MIGSKYTIVGAGAIGGTLATHLHEAGCEVELVDADESHVAAVRERGLELRTPSGMKRTNLPAFGLFDAPDRVSNVLLCVKSQATVSAVEWLLPRLHADGFVASMQNGMNEPAIAARVGSRRTVAAFVDLFADVVEPGVISDGGAGAIALGELVGDAASERVRRLAHDLRTWGSPIVTDNVEGFLWSKLGFGAMLVATALADEDMSRLIDSHRPCMTALSAEVFDVAASEQVRLEGFDAFDPSAYTRHADSHDNARATDELVGWLSTQSKTRSGVWRDIAIRKRPTEVRSQYEPVFAIAERNGIDTPILRELVSLVDRLESNEIPMSDDHLTALDDKAVAAK